MGLSDSVDALLDAYSRCISLLKVFGSSNAAGSSRSVVVPGPTSSDLTRQSDLSRSLQNDRARIKKAYLDRLSETGSQLQKGDGKSSLQNRWNSPVSPKKGANLHDIF